MNKLTLLEILEIILIVIDTNNNGIIKLFIKIPIKFIINNNIGSNILVVVIIPVVSISVVISGNNIFIKQVKFWIDSFVKSNIETKLLITNVVIIKYCIKNAILLADLFSKPSIIALNILCIIITINTEIIIFNTDVSSFEKISINPICLRLFPIFPVRLS